MIQSSRRNRTWIFEMFRIRAFSRFITPSIATTWSRITRLPIVARPELPSSRAEYSSQIRPVMNVHHKPRANSAFWKSAFSTTVTTARTIASMMIAITRLIQCSCSAALPPMRSMPVGIPTFS